MNQEELEYFSTHWQPRWDNKKFSGWALLQKFHSEDKILDIGCGTNPLKEKLGDQVYGIDPAFDQADEKISWEDYEPTQDFNVFLCLGSLNFGTTEEVETQLQKLSNMAKTGDRVYWRQNTFGNDHPWHEDSENVRFFAWSKDLNEHYCKKYNFTLKDIQDDAQNRLYAEWIKND